MYVYTCALLCKLRGAMSQATTTATTWTVAKYSRCYANGLALTSNDWQHYTTPTMHLTLERTTASDGAIVSVRLRVVWRLDDANMDLAPRTTLSLQVVEYRHHICANPVPIKENLDLLEYSTHHQFSDTTHGASGQGMPLRAVYGDKAVALRYLWPLEVPAGRIPVSYLGIPLQALQSPPLFTSIIVDSKSLWRTTPLQ